MMTKFKFYDTNNTLKDADLVIALELNGKKYVAYELEEEKNLENDVIYIGEYELVDNQPYIYDVSAEEINLVKTKIDEILTRIA